MPTDLFLFGNGTVRVDLDLIYPRFLPVVLDALAAAKARGQRYYAQRGTATFEFQGELHAKWLAGTGGRAAPAGDSAHNYGIALDFTADSSDAPGLQPTWDVDRYAILREEVEKRGLVSGASFGDWPHVNLKGYSSAHELAVLKALYVAAQGDTKAKLGVVWAYLDHHAIVAPAATPFVGS